MYTLPALGMVHYLDSAGRTKSNNPGNVALLEDLTYGFNTQSGNDSVSKSKPDVNLYSFYAFYRNMSRHSRKKNRFFPFPLVLTSSMSIFPKLDPQLGAHPR